MKRLFSIVASLLLCFSAFAQQELFGGPGVESPVINADGTVTFTTTHFSVFSVLYSDSASSGVSGVVFFAAALAAAIVVLMVAAVLHFKKF